MIKIIDEPRDAKPWGYVDAAKRLAEFAKDHPGQWCESDELPPTYADKINRGDSSAFRPRSCWIASGIGKNLYVKYTWYGSFTRQDKALQETQVDF